LTTRTPPKLAQGAGGPQVTEALARS